MKQIKQSYITIASIASFLVGFVMFNEEATIVGGALLLIGAIGIGISVPYYMNKRKDQ